jgi:Rps23 Pro-64 3,4-dihydroxylase Tpa1-like proline 4-hydroxylase
MTEKASKVVLSYKGAFSRKLRTKQIGHKEDFNIQVRNEFTNITSQYDFVYSVSLAQVEKEVKSSDLFTKLIKIFPKFVLVNKFEATIKYRQYLNEEDDRILESKERAILYWPNNNFQFLLSIKLLTKDERSNMDDNKTKWDWTRGFSVK